MIGHSNEWPRAIRKMLYANKHLNYRERFIVTVFLLENAVNPLDVTMLMRDLYIHMDHSAVNHIASLIKAYPKSNWTQYNVSQKRSVGHKVFDPHNAAAMK